MSSRRAFTLIELLVVIAIIGILAVVVVLTLNPAQLLAQSRDANRISDMATLVSAINLFQADQSGALSYSMGSPNTVYPSLPDSGLASSTCGDLGLLAVPSGYTYRCATSANLRLASNSGWIPINFQAISSGAPLGALPVDPTNSSSSGLYYTYDTNGTTYEVTAGIESSKYKLAGSSDVISSDGGVLASVYEKGTKMGLEPVDYGDPTLVGYWPLNEGTGTATNDDSGNNNTGTWNGTPYGTNGNYSPGKVQPWAGAFDGSSTYVYVGTTSTYFNFSGSLSEAAWIQTTKNDEWIATYQNNNPLFYMEVGSTTVSGANNKFVVYLRTNAGTVAIFSGVTTVDDGNWHFVAFTRNVSSQIVTLYVDGKVDATSTYADTGPITTTGGNHTIGNTYDGFDFLGLINDVRVYNRVLSGAEITALYNAGK